MKVLVLLVLVKLAQAISSKTILDEEWKLFKIQYGKNYPNPNEDAARKFIYIQNREEIARHNLLYVQSKETFQMGLNQFADMNEDEVVLGLKEHEKNLLELIVDQQTKVEWDHIDMVLPEKVDWREKGAVTPVKNQGKCGSCWTFSTTGTLEGQMKIVTGEIVSLSEQNLVDCSKKDHGCNGGHTKRAIKYVKEHGIATEESYPYEAKDGPCRFEQATAAPIKVHAYIQVPVGEKYLMKAVAKLGPIAVSINAQPRSFHLYSEGVYSDSTCSSDVEDADHAVLVVGYGSDSDSGLDYWLVKNSWGTTWGDEGYIRVARKKNVCGIINRGILPVLNSA